MKSIMIISVVVVFLAGLVIASSELANPFTGAAVLDTTQVANQHQKVINTVDEQAYQNEAKARQNFQDTQSQIEINRIQADAQRDQTVLDAQNQATLAEISRRNIQNEMLSEQAVQHDWDMKQAELRQAQSEAALKRDLLQFAGYAAICMVMVTIIAISIGLSVQIARRPEKLSGEERKHAIEAARAREINARQKSLIQPLTISPTKMVIQPNGNGHNKLNNKPYNELPRVE